MFKISLIIVLISWPGSHFARASIKNEMRCPSLEILYLYELQRYENCTVIEGHLHINFLSISYENVSKVAFRHLREIVDYLFIFKLSGGLPDLSLLFPSLMVIRGQQTFRNYSFVYVYNRIKGLNLYNLREITRGGVLVERNPELCRPLRIDWSAIVRDVNALVRFANNRIICPDLCPSSCPYCWSDKSCQRICSTTCRKDGLSCHVNDREFCCHPYCAGGCYGPGPEQCLSCRGFLHGRTCVQQCPPGYYELNGHRCVTKEECLNTFVTCDRSQMSHDDYFERISKCRMNKSMNIMQRNYLIVANKSCVAICPSSLVAANDSSCEPCGDDCLFQRCKDISITTLEDVASVRGCRHVNKIKISVHLELANFTERLVEAFKHLQEVRESIVITQSKSITSLEFLRSLRRIRGCSRTGNGSKDQECIPPATAVHTVFEVSANEDLHDVWLSTKSTGNFTNIKIDNGQVTFRLNRRLCPTKIFDFLNYDVEFLEGSPLTNKEMELIEHSNGDLAICKLFPVNVTIVESKPKAVSFKVATVDHLVNSLLYTIVIYRPVPEGVVDLKRKRDCVNSEWLVSETACLQTHSARPKASNGEDDSNSVYCGLDNLKPATRYALYVEVKASYAGEGGATDVVFFDTKWDQPSSPQDLLAQSLSPTEVLLRWVPPAKPNGILQKYVVTIKRLPLQEEGFDSTDFCYINSQENQWSLSMNAQTVLLSQHRPEAENYVNLKPSLVRNLIENRFCNCSECYRYCSAVDGIREFPDMMGVVMSNEKRGSSNVYELAQEHVLFDDHITNVVLHSWYMGHTEPEVNVTSSLTRHPRHVIGTPLSTSMDESNTTAPTEDRMSLNVPPSGLSPSPPDKSLDPERIPGRTQMRDITVELVASRTHFIFTNLSHFTEYLFRVIACQYFPPPSLLRNNTNRLPSGEDSCSHAIFLSHWTLPARDVDNIDHIFWSEDLKLVSLISNNSEWMYSNDLVEMLSTTLDVQRMNRILLWQKPLQPNGAVLHFWLRFRFMESSVERVNSTRQWISICLSMKSWANTLKPYIIERVSNDQWNDLMNPRSISFGGHSFANFAPGDYEYQVMAVTIAGNSTWSQRAVFQIDDPAFDTRKVFLPILIVVLVIVLVPILVALKWYLNKRHKATLLVLANPEYAAFSADWCIEREQLIVLDKEPPLGKGSFGLVLQGILNDFTTPIAYKWPDRPLRVAVKTLAAGCDVHELKDFLYEANIMKGFTAPHVVQFFGLVKPSDSRMKEALHTPENPTCESMKWSHDCQKTVDLSNDVFQGVAEITLSQPSGSDPDYTSFHVKEDSDYQLIVRCTNQGITFTSVEEDERDRDDEDDYLPTDKMYSRVAAPQQSAQREFRCMASTFNAISPSDPLVVMELMQLGDLATYLRREGDRLLEGVMPDEIVLRWSAEIADGMFYLSQQGCVHRDLAARNCLLNGDLTVKIGDFGLARRIGDDGYYRKHGRGKLPIRWMSPEALKTASFTEKSDVWSYGVVLWEVATLASLPYYGMDNEEVMEYVLNSRGHLGQNSWPDKCPPNIIKLMSMCWEFDSKKRPSFDMVLKYLEPHVTNEFRAISYYLSHRNMRSFNCPDNSVHVVLT